MPDNAPLPLVRAMVLCDHLYRDQGTGKFVIAGTFTSIASPKFPLVHQTCFLYANLTDFSGPAAVIFRLVDLADGSTVGESGTVKFTVQDRLKPFELPVRLPPLVLPHPGFYSIDLLWGEARAPLASWKLEGILIGETK